MKTFKILFFWTVGALLLLQLIRIDVPAPPKASPQDEVKAPKEVMSLLKKSCYDCHSNHTRWPWYSNIAPISFEVRGHVRDGRNWLNFSIWQKYDEKKRQKLFKGIAESVQRTMPPPDYMLMHKDARLKPQERELIRKWAESHIKENAE